MSERKIGTWHAGDGVNLGLEEWVRMVWQGEEGRGWGGISYLIKSTRDLAKKTRDAEALSPGKGQPAGTGWIPSEPREGNCKN
jgi:hypothetical protein